MLLKINFLNRFLKLYFKRFLYVACSGGIDSCLLIYFLYNYTIQNNFYYKLIIIHVNHYQNNIFSDFYENYIIRQCVFFNPVCVVKIKKDNFYVAKFSENFFRLLRLFIFEVVVSNIGSLFLAHHLNDQKEMFFENLVQRGYFFGIMYKICIKDFFVIRPLLGFSKFFLLQLSKKMNLRWVTDFSNFFIFCFRNFLRNFGLSFFNFIFPFFIYSVQKFLLYLVQLYKFFTTVKEIIFYNLSDKYFGRLNIWKFFFLSNFFKKELIKYWILMNYSIKYNYKFFFFLFFNILIYFKKYFFLSKNDFLFFFYKDYFYIIGKKSI